MAGVAVAPKPAIPLPEDPPIQDLQPDWNSMNQKGVDAIYVSTTRLVPLIPNITQLRNLTDLKKLLRVNGSSWRNRRRVKEGPASSVAGRSPQVLSVLGLGRALARTKAARRSELVGERRRARWWNACKVWAYSLVATARLDACYRNFPAPALEKRLEEAMAHGRVEFSPPSLEGEEVNEGPDEHIFHHTRNPTPTGGVRLGWASSIH
ncbi:hypothetical protein F5141DRAFT_1060199 [Pisolithus sp. B1]|nr:hypothetical protein F5141DRAFT_1060199 [Pisolithus sp. B1]